MQVDRERKNLAAETTLSQDIFDDISFTDKALEMLEIVWNRYQKFEKPGKSLSLKVNN